MDVPALVQQVLRETYLEAAEDPRHYAEGVRELNRRKKAIREYLAALRKLMANVVSTARERAMDVCQGDKNDEMLATVIEEHGHDYDLGEVECELCIPDRVPPDSLKNVRLLEDESARWNERLAVIGDDAQLAHFDLQNALQKQQQTLEMMSRISKMVHDTAMAVMRGLGD